MKTIGFIGTGVMGAPMCSHIMKKTNYKEIYVYNRSKHKAEKLINLGAIWGESIKNMAQKCDIVFTIIGYPKDVEEVYMGEAGLIKNSKKGTILVEMTSSTPELAKKIYETAKKEEVYVLDSPVTGGELGARTGNLSIMVGGDEKIYKQILPFLDSMGKDVAYMGKPGNGQHTKLANQIAIATNMAGTVEMLLYAKNAGLDQKKAISLIGGGSASSWQMINMGNKILESDFEPGFFIKHFVKDMGIVLEEAKKMRLMLPTLSLINQFYISAMKQKLGEKGTQALYKVLERM